MITTIHSTAIVSPKAQLGEGVVVGPHVVIDDDVIIGDGTTIKAHAYIANGARIGKDCRIFQGAVISEEPQDLKYDGAPTTVFIGDRTHIREYVTVHRGTSSETTTIGSDCLIMSYCHVAHDCRVGSNVIMSNVTQLAGHVTVEDWVIIGGVAKIHQFCKLGCHSMIGADCKVVKDVSPYTLIGRSPSQVEGINKVGLRRRGFSAELIQEIESFYDTILFSGFNNRDGIAKFLERGTISPEVQHCIDFINNSSRGIHR